MKKNGFTLVELLATLVILSLVLSIAYPRIADLVENEHKRTFEISVNSLIRGAHNACANAQSELSAGEKTYVYKDGNFVNGTEILEMSNPGKFISSSTITYNKDCEISLSVEDDGYKATKNYSDDDISIVKK